MHAGALPVSNSRVTVLSVAGIWSKFCNFGIITPFGYIHVTERLTFDLSVGALHTSHAPRAW